MIIVEILICLLLLVTLIPVSVLFLQVLMALFPEPRQKSGLGARPAATVLVPAHDEAGLIGKTLLSIVAQLDQGDRLVVVADNCSDETATIAAAAGATVIARRDPTRFGKTYALEFGIRHLQLDPPAVVVIVDADCEMAQGALDVLARSCAASGCPAQADYRMFAREGSPVTTRIAAFAWIVKNRVRSLGMKRLGLPCQLMGSGMAIPWHALAEVSLSHVEIAEDYKLGMDLTLAGYPAVFQPGAIVTSFFPTTAKNEASQRRRWEHGHLQLILSQTHRLLRTAVARGSVAPLGLALDLVVPPLSMLMLTLVLLVALSLPLATFGNVLWPLGLSAIASGLFGTSMTVAWLRWGREAVSFASLLSIPTYVLRKLPLYVAFVTKRQKTWVKTGRD